MGKLLVRSYTVSADGFGAGPGQSLETPLGAGGEELHDWMVGTRTFIEMYGGEGGTTGIDDQLTREGFENLGAWIMGRNMFGPVRGPWPNGDWKGWWGENPPYHVPVFVLTHFPREPLAMEGGTTFSFVTEGIDAALRLAREAAGEKDIRIGGGAATIRQYLQARLLDAMHIAIAPRLLGSGEPLFAGLDLRALGYQVTGYRPSDLAMHVIIERRD